MHRKSAQSSSYPKKLLHPCSKLVRLSLLRKSFMSSKLFIAGFPYALTEQELNDSFAQAGSVVSAKIINDKETGKSRGFGFVEMATEAEAEAAIEMWNGRDLGGRKVVVNIARPMEPRSHSGQGGRGYNRENRNKRDFDDSEFGR